MKKKKKKKNTMKKFLYFEKWNFVVPKNLKKLFKTFLRPPKNIIKLF